MLLNPTLHLAQDVSGRYSVLVLDGDAATGLATTEALEASGNLMTEYRRTGEEAIRHLVEQPALPDLVLMDLVRLPTDALDPEASRREFFCRPVRVPLDGDAPYG